MQSICLEEAGVTGPLAEDSTLVGLTFGGYLRSKVCPHDDSSTGPIFFLVNHCQFVIKLRSCLTKLLIKGLTNFGKS